MKKTTYSIIIAAAIVTIVIGIKSMNSPVSAAAVGFICWAITPYLYLAIMTKVVSKKASILTVFILTLLMGCFGVWAFVDAMYIHADAQGGLVFVFAPLWQWVVLLLMTLPVYYLNRKGGRDENQL